MKQPLASVVCAFVMLAKPVTAVFGTVVRAFGSAAATIDVPRGPTVTTRSVRFDIHRPRRLSLGNMVRATPDAGKSPPVSAYGRKFCGFPPYEGAISAS